MQEDKTIIGKHAFDKVKPIKVVPAATHVPKAKEAPVDKSEIVLDKAKAPEPEKKLPPATSSDS